MPSVACCLFACSIIAARAEVLYVVSLGCFGVFYAMMRGPFFLVVGGIVVLGVILTGLGHLADRAPGGASDVELPGVE